MRLAVLLCAILTLSISSSSALVASDSSIVVHSVAPSQRSLLDRWLTHNVDEAKLQPTFVNSMFATSPRLSQLYRLSVSHSYTAAHAEVWNSAYAKGLTLLPYNRLEISIIPPPYIARNNTTLLDGAGDLQFVPKIRLVSGNVSHGNFIVSTYVPLSLPTGSHTNGAESATFAPTIAAAKMFGRFDIQQTVGGLLPSGRVQTQGRSVTSNTMAQYRLTKTLWAEAEDNACRYYGGSHDGRIQNFVAPVLYLNRIGQHPDAPNTQPYWLLGLGMQIATSRFHTSDHNAMVDLRFIF
jgi:hypothetical protein